MIVKLELEKTHTSYELVKFRFFTFFFVIGFDNTSCFLNPSEEHSFPSFVVHEFQALLEFPYQRITPFFAI